MTLGEKKRKEKNTVDGYSHLLSEKAFPQQRQILRPFQRHADQRCDDSAFGAAITETRHVKLGSFWAKALWRSAFTFIQRSELSS